MISILNHNLSFPPVTKATKEGILALGGDLSPNRLLLAYQSGIFPWYSQGEPILWWSPNPRFVLFPDKVHTPKSMKRVLNQKVFQITFDLNFKQVIAHCAKIQRPYQKGTWITDDMLKAYIKLHQLGYTHSVEVWQDQKLVGGLYGLSLGRCFFGESMFSLKPNASKAGFLTLAKKLNQAQFTLIDSQVPTYHLTQLGGVSIDRGKYMDLLKEALTYPTLKGNWGQLPQFSLEEESP